MTPLSQHLKKIAEEVIKLSAAKTITFLGTGPSEPITDRGGKSNRDNTSTLLNYKGEKYLIDIPRTFNERRWFDYLLVTHFHRDAIGGFKYVEKRKFLMGLPEKLFDEFKKEGKSWTKKKLPVGKESRIGELKVTPFEVAHDPANDFPTYGYHIELDNYKITYSSDMIKIPKESEKYFNNIDILITDGAGWDSNLVGHFGILPFLSMLKDKEWDIKRIYFTQIGRPVPNFNKAQRIIKEKDSRASLTYDGMIISL